MYINLKTIDLCPGQGGGGNKPETTFSVDPSTQEQTIIPEEGYVFSSGVVTAVTSEIDTNIVPGNIKSGISILGVTGTVNPQKTEDTFTVTPMTSAQTVTPESGHVFSSGTVAAVTSTIDSNITPGNIKSGVTILGVQGTVNPQKLEETFSITPRTTDRIVTPQEGYVFSSGVVTAVTSEIDANIVPENIRTGVSILGVTGNVSPAKSEETFTVNPSTQAQTVTPQSGYTFSSGTVAAVTSSIDQNIVPANIKDGVEILGVLGTYTGGSGRDYRNQTGTVTGLSDLGWDADSIGYYQANAPHYSWQNADYAVTQANKDLYGVVNKDNKGNYSSNTDMEYVPMFDTTGVTSMYNYFLDFAKIKGIPILDTGSVTSMRYMFKNCSSLITIPLLDTSSVTNMNEMFYGCSSLTSIPLLDTGSVTDMANMFRNCSELASIPPLDTREVGNMNLMFYGCDILTTIPLLDTGSVTSMAEMFGNCRRLTTIPALDTSSVTNMGYMFNGCYSLTTIPALDTSNVTNMTMLLGDCRILKTVNGIDFSSLTAAPSNFLMNVTDVTRFIVNGKIDFTWNGSFGLDQLNKIDFDSVKSILQAMSRTTNTNAKTMKLNRTITDKNGQLAALKTQCQNKGWTITGLTINSSGGLVVDDDPEIIIDGDGSGGGLFDGIHYYVGDQATVNGIQMNELLLADDGTLVGYGYLNMDDGLTYYYDTNGNKIDMDYYMDDFDRYLEENGLVH